MFFTGLALGILLGSIIHKYASGVANIEEEAYTAGYREGYNDGERYGAFDMIYWRPAK